MLTNRRGESLNTEKPEVQGNMSVRIQTQILLRGAWRSQNTEHFCSLSGKIIGGRRMMASKLNCRSQSLPCSCAPAFPCVPGQREEMLVVQDGGREGQQENSPSAASPVPGLWVLLGRTTALPLPLILLSPSSVPPAQRRWECAKRLMVCADLQMNLHEFAYISLSVCIHSLRCL